MKEIEKNEIAEKIVKRIIEKPEILDELLERLLDDEIVDWSEVA